MDDLNSLVNQMNNTQVDPEALGEHPRFSQFKNVGKAAEQQAIRRQEAIERQRNSRFDYFNHARRLAMNEMDEDEEDKSVEISQDVVNDGSDIPIDLTVTKRRFKSRYANELMLSEWLVDIPEQLSEDWYLVPSPIGKRALVVASKGVTTAYNKGGKMITQFQSRLPGGSNRSSGYTILDCILDKNTFYCLDILGWNSHAMSPNPFDFRLFMLNSKLNEIPQISCISKKFTHRFLPLPYCKCEKTLMEKLLSSDLGFELDGVLFYHSAVLYKAGMSPLVGWLKPWMLPEILGISVPEKFLDGNTNSQSSQEFIDEFNIKHNHLSQIDRTMDSTNI